MKNENRVSLISAVIYTAISLALALAFVAVSTAMGKYTDVARYGGAVWVFLLSMIITMPTVTPLVKKRLKG